jgi:hypothetical protein
MRLQDGAPIMANVDRARKLLVRTALVTSSTIATLIGAQDLALLDRRQIEQALTPPLPTVAPATSIPASPTIEIIHAAPSVTILRRPGQTGPLQPPPAQSAAIQPPAPVQLAPPDPVIVQGEAPPPIIIQQASGSSSGGGSSSNTQSSR